jgi:uracil-DNA glycosylase family 4
MAKRRKLTQQERSLIEFALASGIDYDVSDAALVDPLDILKYVEEKNAIPALTANDSPITTPKGSASPLVHPATMCQSLEELKQAMTDFELCDLKKTATNLVFSDGNPKASIMVIGEAPGADEDRLGKPFVGLSGQLLDRMFASIGLNRDSLYITNILPWRPPANRTPTSQEVALFRPFVLKHVELINPRLLLFVGGVSAKTMLDTQDGILKLRAKPLFYETPTQKTPAYALFHPAYLLRSPSQKAQAWKDLLGVRAFCDKHAISSMPF